jgi:hypothetical protein
LLGGNGAGAGEQQQERNQTKLHYDELQEELWATVEDDNELDKTGFMINR